MLSKEGAEFGRSTELTRRDQHRDLDVCISKGGTTDAVAILGGEHRPFCSNLPFRQS